MPLPKASGLSFALMAIILSGCATSSGQSVEYRAQVLAERALIIDTHIDVPYRLQRGLVDVGAATATGEFDFPRAKVGGLNAPFMSIYIPASVDAEGNAFSFAMASMRVVNNIIEAHPDKFALATCSDDLLKQQAQNLISFPMGMENGGPIEGKTRNLEIFFERGIRYITLAHSKSNHISDSSYDPERQWQGLSEFGKALIPEMNRLGVMVDVSHISDDAFWQVLEVSKVPVIASHSSMRHYTPGFERNMSDEMVKAMAAKGGVIQINFGSSFVHQAARDWSTARTSAATTFAEENNAKPGDDALVAFLAQYREQNLYPYATTDQVLDHIDRAVEIAGIDAVGIGSDYDGVGDSLPEGLKDVATYPNLIAGLIERGYSDEDIEKIMGLNTLRVWRANEAYARSQGTPTRCQT